MGYVQVVVEGGGVMQVGRFKRRCGYVARTDRWSEIMHVDGSHQACNNILNVCVLRPSRLKA